jgi:hypothetical protein
MSGDPGLEMKVVKEEGMDNTKLYPYLSFLNNAQLKGKSALKGKGGNSTEH